MEKAKEMMKDPKKMEEGFEQAWKMMDPQNQGFISYDIFIEKLKDRAKFLGGQVKEPTPEEIEETKKIADPNGTGKVTKENYFKLLKHGLEKMKAAGKI